jgi:hypothetical protein
MTHSVFVGGVSFSVSAAATDDLDARWMLEALRELLRKPVAAPVTGASRTPAGSSSSFSWASPRDDDAAPSVVAARVLGVLRDTGFGAMIDHYASLSPAGDDVHTLLTLLEAAEDALLYTPRSSSRNGTVIGSPLVTLASETLLEYAGSSVRTVGMRNLQQCMPCSRRLLCSLPAQFATGDFNGDGSSDVAIGAYGFSLNALPTSAKAGTTRMLMQSGAIYTQYSNSSAISAAAASAPAPPIPFPAAVTYGFEMYARLGWAMCALDFNAGKEGRVNAAVACHTPQTHLRTPLGTPLQTASTTSPPLRQLRTGTGTHRLSSLHSITVAPCTSSLAHGVVLVGWRAA